MEGKSNLTVRDRIKCALKEYDFSVSKLAGGYSCSAQTKLNRQINGETMISCETIEHVLATFPNLSAEWLLRGEGTMLRVDKQATQLHQHVHTDGGAAAVSGTGNVSQTNVTCDAEIELLRDAVKQRDKEIELLETMVRALRSGMNI